MQQYTLGAFEGSVARRNKNKTYYDEHLRALDLQKEDESKGDEELKRKMLFLAKNFQYEDDFDDQNFYTNKNRKQQAQDSSDEDKPKKVIT